MRTHDLVRSQTADANVPCWESGERIIAGHRPMKPVLRHACRVGCGHLFRIRDAVQPCDLRNSEDDVLCGRQLVVFPHSSWNFTRGACRVQCRNCPVRASAADLGMSTSRWNEPSQSFFFFLQDSQMCEELMDVTVQSLANE